MSNEAQLEKTIDYKFKNKELLINALRHSSYINENDMEKYESNERLEFLGDAVLDLMITNVLFSMLPDATEGYLTKLRADIVRESSLRECAEYIKLGDYIYLGKGEENSGGKNKPSVLANSFEALIGAIYLDGGYKEAKKMIKSLFTSKIDYAVNEGIRTDSKTKLQEIAQRNGEVQIVYKVDKITGPDHDKVFFVKVLLNDSEIGMGTGKNKKEAEQSAAQNALTRGDLDVLKKN